MINRRHFTSLTALALSSCTIAAAPAKARDALPEPIAARLRAIERGGGGQLGVHIFDTATGAEFGHRADERFLMCSTFKLLAAACVLKRAELGQESLARRIVVKKSDLLPHSPVTAKRVGGTGMTLAELCHATITTSDNAAGNLILAADGGPAAVTAFVRTLGDAVTRLDRYEPALNDHDGDLDTTSPRAMVHSLRQLLLGDALSPASRDQLQQWMRATVTGGARLKAGLPAGWEIGDKTGTGDDTSADIAVVWPPGRAPLLVAAYLSRSAASSAVRDAALAQVGALLPPIASGAVPR
jgi:beta-lactamase class A